MAAAECSAVAYLFLHHCVSMFFSVECRQEERSADYDVDIEDCLFPLLLIIMFLHLLVKLATNLSSFVIGFFMLFFIGCGIYNVVQAQWLNVALLAGLILVTFILTFLIVWVEMMVGHAVDFIRRFYF